MAREEIVPALGLYTDVNPSTTPKGALSKAEDVCIDRPNLIEPRPGFDRAVTTVSTAARASALAPFLSHLLELNADGTCEDQNTASAITGLQVPPRVTDREYATAQARGSLYATGTRGMQKLDSLTGTWDYSGLQRALGAVVTPADQNGTGAGINSPFVLYDAVAYRFVLKRTDANGYIRRSQPSERCIWYAGYNTNVNTINNIAGAGPFVINFNEARDPGMVIGTNIVMIDSVTINHAVSAQAAITAIGATSVTVAALPAGSATATWVQSQDTTYQTRGLATTRGMAALLTIDLQSDARVGDELEIYRSVTVDGRVGLPSDQMYLLASIKFNAAQLASGHVLFTDYLKDSDLTTGAELYTNSTQLGILQSKSHPPWCSDVAVYNRMMIYGDIKTPWRLGLELFNMGLDLTGVGAPMLPNIFRSYGASTGPVNGGQLTFTGGSPIVATVNDLRGYVGATIVEGFGGPNYPGVSAHIPAYSKIISATAATITLDHNATAPGVSANSTLWPTFTVDSHDYYGTDRDNPGNFEFPLWLPVGALIIREPSALYAMSKLAHLINITSARVSAWIADEQFSAQDGAWRNLAKPRLDLEWRYFDTDTAPTFTYCLLDYGSGLTQAFEGQRTTPQLSNANLTLATSTGLVPTPFLRDAFEGSIGISSVDEPESVPPLNYAPVGDQFKRIRRLIATTTALWAWKDDGLYRISGFDPSTLRIDLVDPTLRILRSEAADAGGQAVYVWTTQGPGILSDAGFQPISKPIRNLLLPLEQAFAPYPTGIHGLQVTYDRVERRVFFCAPATAGDKDATISYVWSENTQAWTKWHLSSSAMCWDPATGKIRWSFIDPTAGNKRVMMTTRDRSMLAYTGDLPAAATITAVVTAGGITTLTFAALPAGSDAFDAVSDSNGNLYTVTGNVDPTHVTVAVATGAPAPATGACVYYTHQPFNVAWQLRPQPSPFIEKVYRDTRAIFHDMRGLLQYSMIYRSFTSQAAPLLTQVTVAVPPVAATAPTDYLRRVGVPRGVARAGNFDIELACDIAGVMFSIGGMAVTYEEGSEMLSR